MHVAKTLAIGITGVAMSLLAAFPIAAHGNHKKVSLSYPVCTVEGCDEIGRHTHGRRQYCGYDHESGYCDGSCCPVCTVEDCDEIGRHMHDDLYYCGYAHESGYCDDSCYPVCHVEGCTEAGRHTHDNLHYCGYNHESGYCDGSCEQIASTSHHRRSRSRGHCCH